MVSSTDRSSSTTTPKYLLTGLGKRLLSKSPCLPTASNLAAAVWCIVWDNLQQLQDYKRTVYLFPTESRTALLDACARAHTKYYTLFQEEILSLYPYVVFSTNQIRYGTQRDAVWYTTHSFRVLLDLRTMHRLIAQRLLILLQTLRLLPTPSDTTQRSLGLSSGHV